MTWRLKDKKLQKQLDEISDGDFSEALAEGRFQSVSSPLDPNIKWRVYFGDVPDFLSNRFSVCFTDDEVEEVPEYNSNDWNEYPKVEPPRNIPMRLEIFRNDYQSQHTHRYAAVFLAGNWWNENDMIEIKENDEIRFRPWED